MKKMALALLMALVGSSSSNTMSAKSVFDSVSGISCFQRVSEYFVLVFLWRLSSIGLVLYDVNGDWFLSRYGKEEIKKHEIQRAGAFRSKKRI